MDRHQIQAHAHSFAAHIRQNTALIHKILRQYQSKEVVDDEIERSLDFLENITEVEKFLQGEISRTSVFLPLNLPLYSFVIFVVAPYYISKEVVIRPPTRMQAVFKDLFEQLELSTYYPNVILFEGNREKFLGDYCKLSNVVIFTGKYENFLKIKKACGKEILLLYNGVGHNPIVVTESGNVALAVEKCLHVKLFNNGQDCAGPDVILVHKLVARKFVDELTRQLPSIKCSPNYRNDDTRIGPIFEKSSLLKTSELILDITNKGGKIIHGGNIDFKDSIIYPCVIKTNLKEYRNYTELYNPVFIIIEYDFDQELDLYFNDMGQNYQLNNMYISLFGESRYIEGFAGSIVLKNKTIHDVERGLEEYGGYGPGASSVSYKGLTIAKPLLIPREIDTFLLSSKYNLVDMRKVKSDWEEGVICESFTKAVREIFRDQLVFAYIFGGFASKKSKSFADIDTLICVKERIPQQVNEYLTWLFQTHEVFGKIPDFKYPSEIVEFNELKVGIEQLHILKLSAINNSASAYDAMVWGHSLSQRKIGIINEKSIPEDWRGCFPEQSKRILSSFLDSLQLNSDRILNGQDFSLVADIPRDEAELSNFIENLSNKGIVKILKLVPFEERPVFTEQVLDIVKMRKFIGSKRYFEGTVNQIFNPLFRFGAV